MKKGLAMMALGAGAVLVYQKYGKTIKKETNKAYNKLMKKADKLENMM